MCRKPDWHHIEQCEDTEELEARRFNKIKSDLFSTRSHDLPVLQKNRSHHNSTSPFLRLPPEIRLRIYAHTLGTHALWIGHPFDQHKWNWLPSSPRLETSTEFSNIKERFHKAGRFHIVKGGHGHINNALDLRLLLTCRSIYTETALLPYRLNSFTFQDDAVRQRFERSPRKGKKLAQKKAVGVYDVMGLPEFKALEW